jgi:hypothetical protein
MKKQQVKKRTWIQNSLGRYYRGLETKDFIFFVNFSEGDENACVMMYRHDMSLVSNNYFGYNAFVEAIDEKEWTYMSPMMKYNYKLHQEANA